MHDHSKGKQAVEPDTEHTDALPSLARGAPSPVATGNAGSSARASMRPSHPKPPPTPNSGIPSELPPDLPKPLIPSAPASPPTPAPSPTPHQRGGAWNEQSLAVDNGVLRDFRLVFGRLDTAGKEAWLEDIVDSCDNHLLSHLHALVSPRLKKDPFHVLPNELCFKVSDPPGQPGTG